MDERLPANDINRIAHDLNNVLAGILTYVDLASRQIDPDHPVRVDLEEIRTAAQRGAELTERLTGAESAHAALHPLTSPAGRRVLIVEDDSGLRDLMHRILASAGFQTLIAEGPEEALDLISGGPEIDVLLTDLSMPELPGDELAQKVRAQCPGVRVVFVSGYAEHQVEIVDRGDAGFLQKPFTVQSLLDKVLASLG